MNASSDLHTSRRAILTSAPAGLALAALGVTAPTILADPIHDLIADHKVSVAACIAHEDGEAEWEAYSTTLLALYGTSPTTVEGVRALLKFSIEQSHSERYDEYLVLAAESLLDSPVLRASSLVDI